MALLKWLAVATVTATVAGVAAKKIPDAGALRLSEKESSALFLADALPEAVLPTEKIEYSVTLQGSAFDYSGSFGGFSVGLASDNCFVITGLESLLMGSEMGAPSLQVTSLKDRSLQQCVDIAARAVKATKTVGKKSRTFKPTLVATQASYDTFPSYESQYGVYALVDPADSVLQLKGSTLVYSLYGLTADYVDISITTAGTNTLRFDAEEFNDRKARRAVDGGDGNHLKAKANTPCLKHCQTDPSGDECATCCRSVPHEIDWKCNTPDAAACCTGVWDAECWDRAFADNRNHACNQCGSSALFGCTDSNAINFNAGAQTDDGSCLYKLAGVCTTLKRKTEVSGTCESLYPVPLTSDGLFVLPDDVDGFFDYVLSEAFATQYKTVDECTSPRHVSFLLATGNGNRLPAEGVSENREYGYSQSNHQCYPDVDCSAVCARLAQAEAFLLLTSLEKCDQYPNQDGDKLVKIVKLCKDLKDIAQDPDIKKGDVFGIFEDAYTDGLQSQMRQRRDDQGLALSTLFGDAGDQIQSPAGCEHVCHKTTRVDVTVTCITLPPPTSPPTPFPTPFPTPYPTPSPTKFPGSKHPPQCPKTMVMKKKQKHGGKGCSCGKSKGHLQEVHVHSDNRFFFGGVAGGDFGNSLDLYSTMCKANEAMCGSGHSGYSHMVAAYASHLATYDCHSADVWSGIFNDVALPKQLDFSESIQMTNNLDMAKETDWDLCSPIGKAASSMMLCDTGYWCQSADKAKSIRVNEMVLKEAWNKAYHETYSAHKPVDGGHDDDHTDTHDGDAHGDGDGGGGTNGDGDGDNGGPSPPPVMGANCRSDICVAATAGRYFLLTVINNNGDGTVGVIKGVCSTVRTPGGVDCNGDGNEALRTTETAITYEYLSATFGEGTCDPTRCLFGTGPGEYALEYVRNTDYLEFFGLKSGEAKCIPVNEFNLLASEAKADYTRCDNFVAYAAGDGGVNMFDIVTKASNGGLALKNAKPRAPTIGWLAQLANTDNCQPETCLLDFEDSTAPKQSFGPCQYTNSICDFADANGNCPTNSNPCKSITKDSKPITVDNNAYIPTRNAWYGAETTPVAVSSNLQSGSSRRNRRSIAVGPAGVPSKVSKVVLKEYAEAVEDAGVLSPARALTPPACNGLQELLEWRGSTVDKPSTRATCGTGCGGDSQIFAADIFPLITWLVFFLFVIVAVVRTIEAIANRGEGKTGSRIVPAVGFVVTLLTLVGVALLYTSDHDSCLELLTPGDEPAILGRQAYLWYDHFTVERIEWPFVMAFVSLSATMLAQILMIVTSKKIFWEIALWFSPLTIMMVAEVWVATGTYGALMFFRPEKHDPREIAFTEITAVIMRVLQNKEVSGIDIHDELVEASHVIVAALATLMIVGLAYVIKHDDSAVAATGTSQATGVTRLSRIAHFIVWIAGIYLCVDLFNARENAKRTREEPSVLKMSARNDLCDLDGQKTTIDGLAATAVAATVLLTVAFAMTMMKVSEKTTARMAAAYTKAVAVLSALVTLLIVSAYYAQKNTACHVAGSTQGFASVSGSFIAVGVFALLLEVNDVMFEPITTGVPTALYNRVRSAIRGRFI